MNTPLGPRLLAIARLVAGHSDEFNRLDGVAGDGDLGITVVGISAAIASAIESSTDSDHELFLRGIGIQIARDAASTSGTLVATAFMKAGPVNETLSDVGNLASAIRRGTEAIQLRGKAKLGDKTMLDALYPVADDLDRSAAEGISLATALASAAVVAREAADASAGLEAKIGRAGWLAARAAGHADGGCRLVQRIFESAAEVAGPSTDDLEKK